MSYFNIARADLEAAPARARWNAETVYDSVFLLPTRKKHDSGYQLIRVVGVIGIGDDMKLETAATCDDICWQINAPMRSQTFAMRTDMTYPGGVAHVWGWNTQFRVGASLSSTDIVVEAKA